MKNGGGVGIVAACLAWRAVAQTADDHAAHHPAGPSEAVAGPEAPPAPATGQTPASAPATPPSSTSSTTGRAAEPTSAGGQAMNMGAETGGGMSMGGMMGGTGRDCCGAVPGRPLFPALMALPATDTAERHRLMSVADDRLHRGLALIEQASAEAERATSSQQMQRILERMRDGLSFYDSGAAARHAFSGGQAPQQVALNWFRAEMNLPPSGGHQGPGSWFGFGSTHFFFMTILLLVAAGLLTLQVLRLKRVRDLVSTFAARSPGSTPAQPRVAAGAATTSPPAPRPVVGPPAVSLSSSTAPAAAGTASRRSKTWSGELRVAQIVAETPTVETFRLVEPSSDRLPFDFLPGQFLQVEVETEPGKTVRRSYTIASSPTQRAYVELTVKREEQGVVSRYLHDNVEVGDRLKASGPFGTFTFTGSDANSIVLIAGGVGITPMMSVLRYLTDTAWPGEIFFVYGARSTEEFIFRPDLELLERRHPRLHVLATMQRSPGTVWSGPEGNITKEMLQAAVPDITRRRIHLCGPPGMMAAVRRMLLELGVPEAQIRSEAFGPASLPADDAPGAVTTAVAEAGVVQPPAVPAAPKIRAPEVAAATITFSLSGVSAALPADQTVLEAAEEAGVEIPYQCRVGVCGVCVTRLLEGEVSMAVETGLDPADKAEGYVLACQAKTTGGPLVVEA